MDGTNQADSIAFQAAGQSVDVVASDFPDPHDSAFPPCITAGADGSVDMGPSGMSLRTWMVGQAMQSLGTFMAMQALLNPGTQVSWESVARKACKLADATLAQLRESNGAAGIPVPRHIEQLLTDLNLYMMAKPMVSGVTPSATELDLWRRLNRVLGYSPDHFSPGDQSKADDDA